MTVNKSTMTIKERAMNLANAYWYCMVSGSVYVRLQKDVAKAIRAAIAADRKKRRK